MAVTQCLNEQYLKGKSGSVNEDGAVKIRLEVEG